MLFTKRTRYWIQDIVSCYDGVEFLNDPRCMWTDIREAGSMVKEYDLVVIGTGTAAKSVAGACRSAGWNVAVIDSRPFGGTCAQRGCDPKKVLVGAAETLAAVNRLSGKGVTGNARINWKELMAFKRTFTEPVPEQTEKSFTDQGIDTFHGRASFQDKTTIGVGDDKLQGRYVLIATGAKPATLGIEGEELLTLSDDFLDLDELPKRIAFIGGGYISFEFAHIAARAGAEVTILHGTMQPLAGFDHDLVEQLLEASRKAGIEIKLNARVQNVHQSKKELRVSASGPDGDSTIEVDMVVHGAGRVPQLDDLDLEKAGIEREEKGVRVNEFMQSVSNSSVYAAGDCAATDGLPLTPVASREGEIVAHNLVNGNSRAFEPRAIPTTLFTQPVMASVGLREEEAVDKGYAFDINHEETGEWFTSRRINEPYTGFKVLIEKESKKILGAHILGPHAEEVINLFALAMRAGLTTSDLKSVLYAYPTSSSDIQYMIK